MKINSQKDNIDIWETILVRSIDKIEKIRPIWEEMQAKESYPAINSDIDRYLSVIRALGEKCSPLIIQIKKEGNTKAMVIGRLEDTTIPIKIGYKNILSPKLYCLTITYGGILGQPDEILSSVIIRELKNIIRQYKINVVSFNHLHTDSAFYNAITKRTNFLCRSHFSNIDKHWRMYIPRNLDTFYKTLSKKHRANLRRSIRKFEEDYFNQYRITHNQNTDVIDNILHDAETISKNTYQHAIGAGFLNNLLNQSILNTDITHGRLMISILYIQEKPCAFQWGTLLDKTYFLEKIGYDPEWANFNIGSILFIKVLELLCDKASLEFIDFGFGDATYKKSYGNDSWQEVSSTYIYAFSFYPILINTLDSSIKTLSFGLRWILNITGITQRTKRVWRDILRKKDSRQVEK